MNGSFLLVDMLIQIIGCISFIHAIVKHRSFAKAFLNRKVVKGIRGVIGLFLVIWFIVGSVYIFKYYCS